MTSNRITAIYGIQINCYLQALIFVYKAICLIYEYKQYKQIINLSLQIIAKHYNFNHFLVVHPFALPQSEIHKPAITKFAPYKPANNLFKP